MAGVAPFEIIAAPFQVYAANVGTAFPDVSDSAVTGFTLIGTSGDKNITEDGVTVEHSQTIEVFRPVGLTAARKAFRTEEELKISFAIADISAAQYAKAMNKATVTAVAAGAGVGGQSTIPLLMGMEVSLVALLLKGLESAGGANFNTQYQIPICYQGGNPKPVFKKGEPAMLELEFMALWDSTNGFGKYISQTAAAS